MRTTPGDPDWDMLNGGFKTASKNDPDRDGTASQTPKAMMKALTSACIADPQKGEVFNNVNQSINTRATLTRDLNWSRHKAMLKKWTQDEVI